MNNYSVALNFWKTVECYPNYPNTKLRRFIDTGFILQRLRNEKSLLDIGCGDSSISLALREFTDISSFNCFDVSINLIGKLINRWGSYPGLSTYLCNLLEIDEFPETDVALSLGFFPYVFEEDSIKKILSRIKSKLFIVRVPCTLNSDDELINKFSEELGANYSAIYRTKNNYINIFSKFFNIVEIERAYPDNIESKYGTKHFFFVCERRDI